MYLTTKDNLLENMQHRKVTICLMYILKLINQSFKKTNHLKVK